MTTAMIYPSETAAPSIDTQFVNGIKFDICEVCKEAHDMLSSSRSRFFVVVEDSHIIRYESAERFCKRTGEARWDLFCMTKQDCIDLINKFDDYHTRIKAQLKKAEKPAFERTCMEKANSLRTSCMKLYGTYPV